MKVCTSAAPMPVEVMRISRGFQYARSKHGLSGTSPPHSINSSDRRKPGIGQPIFGVEVKCVDENDREVPPDARRSRHSRRERRLRTSQRPPKPSRAAGFIPGDIGVMDDEGYRQSLTAKI